MHGLTQVEERGFGISPRRTKLVRRGAAVLLLMLAVMPAVSRAQDATIVNRASAVFEAGGMRGTASAEVSISIGRTAAVRLVQSQKITASPGEQRIFPHTLTNLGTARDNFSLNVYGVAAWTYQLYLDLDGNGLLGPSDKLVTDPVSLERNESVKLLLVVEIPVNAVSSLEYAVDVRAVSTNDSAVSDAVRDQITIDNIITTASVVFLKSVDKAEAAPGDTLSYAIAYTNTGDTTVPEVMISDLLPAGLRFVPGSILVDGVAATDAADTDAASVERASDGRDKIDVRLANLASYASRLISLKAAVIVNSSTVITNFATATSSTGSTRSTDAVTNIILPQLELTKELIGESEVLAGSAVAYRLTWKNASRTTSIHDAVLTDTIPGALQVLSVDGAATVSEGVVSWRLGTLAPMETASLVVNTRVATEDEGEIINRAVLRASNAAPVVATARALRIKRAASQKIAVEKRAGVLEASLGDAIPYIVTVRNVGEGSITNIVVHDRLPDGVEFIADKMSGGDSARVNGRDVTIWIAGPLAAGAALDIRYVVSLIAPGSATSLSNLVTADGEEGRVKSDTARAVVQIRRGFAMQSRMLLGKVWLDMNDDGRQNDDERGVPGVEIWSEDGEVVTTDAEGRYSFRNLSLGSHALRLDTLGLPVNARLGDGSNVIARIRMDGWTTPRADFRIVPRTHETRIASVDMVRPPVTIDNVMPVRHTEADTSGVTPVHVAPLRTEAERAAEAAQTFVKGPVVRFFAPTDGIVVTTNRMFVGVEGEAGAKVRLYSDSSLLSEAELRPDGRYDFIGIDVPVGPSNLRVAMKNSFSNEVWDSVRVYRTGPVTQFVADGTVAALRAESQEIENVRVRVLDAWGVPVPGAVITVALPDATITASDNDRTSVGIQLKTNADGILRIPVRAGHQVGPATMEFSSGKKTGRLNLRILPSVRSFIAAGAGQVGIGAASRDFAAIAMKGALGRESSVSLSFDSRRGASEDDFFGRGYDPLDEGRYPAIGDASDRRVLSASTQRLSAKIEHGFDWVEMGDIETGDFGGQGKLATYARSLTGVGARIATGALTWRAFGSLTDQVLSQVQARGNGSSGPYDFGKGIRPGTDKIAVEVRSAENAAIVIAREELERFRDYQIDYSTGEVLLQRPLAAADPSGNPLFLVGMLELKSGGDSRMILGGRLDADAGRLFNSRVADSARVFLLAVRDGGEATGVTRRNDLVGGGFRFQKRMLHAGGEMLRAASFDSSVTAARAIAGISLPNEKGGLEAEWTKVGAGFVPGLDPRLSGASEDLRVTGSIRLSDNSVVRIADSRQKFDAFGVERHSTIIGTTSTIRGMQVSSEGNLAQDQMGLDVQQTKSNFMSGKLKVALSPQASMWIEGSHTLATESSSTLTAPRPDQIETGFSFEVFEGVHLETSQRWVGLGSDTSSYSVSSVKLQTTSLLGGAIWGGVDHASASTAATSATLGWKPRMAVSGGWSVDGMLERRFGLTRAPLSDPLRALPFPQLEQDRIAYGLGTQWLPKDSIGRMSLAGEMRKDQLSRGQKLAFEAEAPMSETAAFMIRSDWWKESRNTGTETELSRNDRSLVAIALRPTASNTFNVLGKVEWRRTANPGMGARFSGTGNDERMIAATDVIWGIRKGTELGARYAVRMSSANDPLIADTAPVRSLSQYVGGRFEQTVRGPVSARIDARLLRTGSGIQRWNAAPSALVTIAGRVDVEGGYRFGNLRDADFATEGGKGFFATLGVRVTERAVSSVTRFWRDRLSQEGR